MSKIAFVFPGQGSQSIGMLSDLAQHYPSVHHVFSEVSERLQYDLWKLIQTGPAAQLNQTEYTQVAMLTADVAVYRVLREHTPIKPTLMAGHSLGEYAALVCADALTLADAAYLVQKRGQFMQQTVPLGQGAMAAIVGLTDEQVKFVCEEASTSSFIVTPANYNAIGQVVIAGHASAVEKAIAIANEMQARLATVIPVSVPCHCPLLNHAAVLFQDILQQTEFHVPSTPVISTVNVRVYQSVESIRMLLKEQLFSPVRWVETIQYMKQHGVETIIECGPGKVLSGLVKRIEKSITAVSVNDKNSVDASLPILNIG